MAQGYSDITIVGNIGKKPEQIEYQKDGETIKGVRFTIAVNDVSGHTNWFYVVSWQSNRFVREILETGDVVLVKGNPRMKEWESRNPERGTVVLHKKIEIVANKIVRINSRRRNNPNEEGVNNNDEAVSTNPAAAVAVNENKNNEKTPVI